MMLDDDRYKFDDREQELDRRDVIVGLWWLLGIVVFAALGVWVMT